VNNLLWQAADGTTDPEPLFPSPSAQTPNGWTPDGRFLIFQQVDEKNGPNVWMLSVADRKARPLVQTPAAEGNASISPDGRWMAYQSDQSGQFEIYVRAFPGPSRAWQVSIDGGAVPMWSPTGRELFFRRGAAMMAATVTAGHDFTAEKPQMLFDGPYLQPYAVARDGRFLMIKPEPQPMTRVNVVQNWMEELKARVPTK
jgi:dipeptidyl aminopeptidase/acylaminoacyl peptidase